MVQLGILHVKPMNKLGFKLFTRGTRLAPDFSHPLHLFTAKIFSILLIRGLILDSFLLESTNKLDFESFMREIQLVSDYSCLVFVFSTGRLHSNIHLSGSDRFFINQALAS